MGEPAGIAGEIAIKAWHAPDGRPVPAFAVLGDPEWLRAEAHRIKSHSHIVEVASLQEASERFADGVPVLVQRLSEKAVPGKPVDRERAHRHRRHRAGGRPCAVGRGQRRRDEPDPQGDALQIRLQVSRPHRVSWRPCAA